jgi:uncharacterized protein (TIRG00374 family)
MKNRLMTALAVLCLGLFLYLFIKVGPARIWGLLKDVAWYNWLLLLLLRLAYLILRTFNWSLICGKYGISASPWILFKARLAAQAVGFLLPQPKIGAEAVRALLLENISKRKGFASVVLVVLGVLAAALIFPMSFGLKITFLALTALLALVIAFLAVKQRKGFFIWLMDVLKKMRLRSKHLEKHRDKIQETDTYIKEFYGRHKSTFVLVFLLYSVLFCLWAFEFQVTFRIVGASGVSFLDGFFILALGNLSYTLPAVPASVGIYEITFVTIFRILKIEAGLGMAVILIRRVLGLFLSGIGIFPILRRKSLRRLRDEADAVPSIKK